jgi:hypothetical protein
VQNRRVTVDAPPSGEDERLDSLETAYRELARRPTIEERADVAKARRWYADRRDATIVEKP